VKILIKGAGDLATGIASRLYGAGHQILMTEIAQLLSKYCEISMVPVNGSRCIVNGEYHTGRASGCVGG